MTIATVATMAVGTGVSLYAKSQAADYQRRVEQQNAALARQQGSRIQAAGLDQASEITAAGARAGGSVLSAMAANGVDTTTGSPANMFRANSANAAADAAKVRANANLQDWQLQNEANQHIANAEMIRRASILGGASDVLGAAGSMTSTGYQMYKSR
jgi:hypothetical protein